MLVNVKRSPLSIVVLLGHSCVLGYLLLLGEFDFLEEALGERALFGRYLTSQ